MRSWGGKHKLKEIAFYFSNFKQTTPPPPKKKKNWTQGNRYRNVVL